MPRILGIDPGTRHLGWGVIDAVGVRLTHVAHGVIHTDEDDSIADRLVCIDEELAAVLDEHKPAEAAVESIFFARDASAAAKLGHARGVVLLACARRKLPIGEYAPARVKKAMGVGGRADKAQVAQMVRAMLRLAAVPKADAADALAIAITHVLAEPMRRMAQLAARAR